MSEERLSQDIVTRTNGGSASPGAQVPDAAQSRAPDPLAPERRAFLAEVAELYYLDQLSQEDIARQLRISRSTVSRLLTEARDTGVIEFRINSESVRDHNLEQRLSERLGLPCSVVANDGEPGMVRAIGNVTARRVERMMNVPGVVAMTHGGTVYETVRAMRFERMPDLQMVQMAGFEVGNSHTHGWTLIKLCFERIGNRYRYIHAPLFVSSEDLRGAITNDPLHAGTLELARDADVALIGVGTVDAETSSLARAGHLDRQALAQARSAGSVGAVNGFHYRLDGTLLSTLNQHVIGLRPTELSDDTHRIVIAGGTSKVLPVIGSVHGGWCDELITDTACANGILEALDGAGGSLQPA
jgi:deoxyribonucleoside regulator